jgi:hypothetical protein
MEQALIGGVPLVAVIIGIVEFCKQMGLAGRALTAASLAVGVCAGVAYQCSIAVPASYAGWFAAIVYGLALGLSAAGINDWAKQFRQS